MHKCGLCRHAVSVCPSVTFMDRVNTNKHIFGIFSPSGSQAILVFLHQTGWRYSDGNLPNGGVECRWGIGRNRDSRLIAGYRRLLDVRTTKWQKQLPTTMQCRSHSRRRTSECLFVTACSVDQYAEEKRTEKNLIVRSGISEAETTNNKRLRSTFCIEAIQTRSISRPHCDRRASCLLRLWVALKRACFCGRVLWKELVVYSRCSKWCSFAFMHVLGRAVHWSTALSVEPPPPEFFFNYGWLSNIFGWYSAQPDLRGQEKMWLNYGWLHNLQLKYG